MSAEWKTRVTIDGYELRIYMDDVLAMLTPEARLELVKAAQHLLTREIKDRKRAEREKAKYIKWAFEMYHAWPKDWLHLRPSVPREKLDVGKALVDADAAKDEAKAKLDSPS